MGEVDRRPSEAFLRQLADFERRLRALEAAAKLSAAVTLTADEAPTSPEEPPETETAPE